jgi:hypothetical protein
LAGQTERRKRKESKGNFLGEHPSTKCTKEGKGALKAYTKPWVALISLVILVMVSTLIFVPVSRVELLAPWLGLAAALVLSTAAVLLRIHKV